MRLDVRRIGQVKAGENNIGNRTRVKIVKNKMAPPFGSCEFDIRFGSGMDALGDLLDIAVESGVVSKNGAYYKFADESLGQGRERARTLLQERADLRGKIEAALPKVVSRGGVESEVAAAQSGGATESKVGFGLTVRVQRRCVSSCSPGQEREWLFGIGASNVWHGMR